MRTLGVILIALFTLFSLAPAAHSKTKRKVTVEWREVEDAEKYDFQLSRTPEMDPQLMRKEFESIRNVFRLSPGTYYFRVRGINSEDAPGPWSEVQGFVVNEKAPRQKKPKANELFKEVIPDAGIEFEWAEGLDGTDYLFEVSDRDGVLFTRKVDNNDVAWRPLKPGIYRWRVGYDTAGGKEWGPYRKFKVTKKAIVTEELLKYRDYGQDISKGSPWNFGIILRGAQAIVAFDSNDLDSGKTASGSALISLGSAELRWRAARSAGSAWLISGSLNAEVIRQSVLSTEFILPRGYARVFVTNGRNKWRVGPFLHVGYGQGGVFVVQSSGTATTSKINRLGLGLGGAAVYQTGPSMYLSAIAMLRYDIGGTSSSLGTMNNNFGFEGGFGIVFNLTSWLMFEGRLRAQQEAYSWSASSGAGTSSFSNMFIIVDVGVGFSF